MNKHNHVRHQGYRGSGKKFINDSIDLGYAALLVSLVRECTAEQAFDYLEPGGRFFEGRRRMWTEEDLEKAIRLRESGEAWKVIADHFGVSYSSVRNAVLRYQTRNADSR